MTESIENVYYSIKHTAILTLWKNLNLMVIVFVTNQATVFVVVVVFLFF